jgi:hypothetical protein
MIKIFENFNLFKILDDVEKISEHEYKNYFSDKSSEDFYTEKEISFIRKIFEGIDITLRDPLFQQDNSYFVWTYQGNKNFGDVRKLKDEYYILSLRSLIPGWTNKYEYTLLKVDQIDQFKKCLEVITTSVKSDELLELIRYINK